MPGVFSGSSPLKRAFVGTTPVKSIWVGTTKVWPTFSRQRMTKNGAWSAWAGQATAWATITGWTSDASYPAVITSNQLVVSGAGSVTITLSLSVEDPFSMGGTEVRLMRHGTQVQAWSVPAGTATRTMPVSMTVADGDAFRLEARGGAASGIKFTGGYLDVNA